MRTLLAQIDLKTILLVLALFGFLIFRLLGWRIGPKSWTNWFWGEAADKKMTPSASK